MLRWQNLRREKKPSPSSRRELSFKVCSLFFFTSDVCFVSTYPSGHLSVLVPVQVQVSIWTLRCHKYCRNKKVTHERGGLSLRTHRDVIAHRMTIGSIMACQTWHTDRLILMWVFLHHQSTAAMQNIAFGKRIWEDLLTELYIKLLEWHHVRRDLHFCWILAQVKIERNDALVH